ncbi:outer membrane porin F [Vibrio nigripulchritudo ATCC 27043]|uniref:Outer membrane protein, OmpA/MotB n=1 Tax=Vibrio nigripulchritudo SOn1 TaxID=1238450 RepID=A0AAV2VMY2_9VIBR|nr:MULTISPECIES: OmpA family protein [Vibrio]EGU56143.1 outer membrane porin F [Vibrio nigripulchritudo ATCC 27043]UAB68889.1 OmpA family protein [Vibrio sp. SCSIO 43132]CCN36518.1 putative Outer membrane protein, OmpA/MotB [Vibrio nigripulchritudo AM115]CCN43412.1 putative Outer membrane protein, OmpA/MotB [Vibrio nigripulchritudo FTn2]CCN67620.1 putative Outer membrane protein, OmpA/MotB [Vibrio nigripulchritudo POn4]
MKYLAIACSALLTLSWHASANQSDDEYDYIDVPKSDQIADLSDDDYDGVVNARDLCTGTPRGASVDNDGCETYIESEDKKQLKVLFANDSDEITPAFITQIRTMAEFLDAYPETSIELQGFASKTGNAEHNLDLSKRRAKAVREALISYGVSHTRIKTIGFGDSVLDDLGESQVSHALNRRVVATVVGYKGSVINEWNIFTTKKK